MLAEEIDFYKIFRLHPTAMALLTADLEVIDANDEFLTVANHPLEQVIGRNVFAVLPKMPPDPGGQPKWTALEAAQTSGRREYLSLTRYDIEDPAIPGVFQERYWSSSVTPVRGRDGVVEVLEFSAREVTSIITEYKKLQYDDLHTGSNRPLVPSPSLPADNYPVPAYQEV
jgi:PAS domain-containing protein